MWYTSAPLTKLDLHGLPTLLAWDHARYFTRLWDVDASVIEEGEVIRHTSFSNVHPWIFFPFLAAGLIEPRGTPEYLEALSIPRR